MKQRIITSILTVLTITGLYSQAQTNTPRLIVGITIDQLRTDYLEAFSDLFGDKGFKRLWNEGRVYRNTEYSFSQIDRASAVASLFTGTTPSVNGIIGNHWLDISTLRPVHCADDPAFMGNYTTENSSPAKLLTTTVADELKMATQNQALVYAISPFRETAIFGAGHAGNGAFWINSQTGKWCGTTYYGEFPRWISRYNEQNSIDYRVANLIWSPTLPSDQYISFSSNSTAPSFRYKFDDGKENRYRRFIHSPFVNDEVNILANECLNNSEIGLDDVPDLLLLTYYAGNYNYSGKEEFSQEIQDTYVRLDKSIAWIIDQVEKKFDLTNVIFVVTSTGNTDSQSVEFEKYRLPTGEFYLNRCSALLNMYLMATYGEGQYVEAYYNQQIYLNRSLIEEKKLDLAEIQHKSAEFLMQFSGVNEVYSGYRLLLGAWSPEVNKIRNGYNRKRSGDLLIDVLPGWTVIDENAFNNKVVHKAYTPAPLIFLGGSVKKAIIHTPVSTDHIAPTLTHFMRIRAPNACTTTPITDIR